MSISASQLICLLIMFLIIGFSVYKKIDYKLLLFFGVIFLALLSVVYLILNSMFGSDCSIEAILSFNRIGCSPALFTIAFSSILAAAAAYLLKFFNRC